MSMIAVNATPNGTRMMWKPSVNAIIWRAGSTWEEPAASSGTCSVSDPPMSSTVRRGSPRCKNGGGGLRSAQRRGDPAGGEPVEQLQEPVGGVQAVGEPRLPQLDRGGDVVEAGGEDELAELPPDEVLVRRGHQVVPGGQPLPDVAAVGHRLGQRYRLRLGVLHAEVPGEEREQVPPAQLV